MLMRKLPGLSCTLCPLAYLWRKTNKQTYFEGKLEKSFVQRRAELTDFELTDNLSYVPSFPYSKTVFLLSFLPQS